MAISISPSENGSAAHLNGTAAPLNSTTLPLNGTAEVKVDAVHPFSKTLKYLIAITSLIIEPLITAKLGLSTAPTNSTLKKSKVRSLFSGSSAPTLTWRDHLLTTKGWILNLKQSIDHWESRFALIAKYLPTIVSNREAKVVFGLAAIAYLLYKLLGFGGKRLPGFSVTSPGLTRPKVSANGYGFTVPKLKAPHFSLSTPHWSAPHLSIPHLSTPHLSSSGISTPKLPGSLSSPHISIPGIKPISSLSWNPFSWIFALFKKIPFPSLPGLPKLPSFILAGLGWLGIGQATKPKPSSGDKFDVDAAYGSVDTTPSTVVQDLKAVGLKVARGDIKTLLEFAFSKGKPINDKDLAMEKIVAIAGSLPPNSKARKQLTNIMIEGLWNSLQHPPLSYQGDKFQYRTPDGSYNNVLYPDLGKAGTPYARTARRVGKLHGVRPDPALLFDMLMARPEGKFKENPAGISTVLFYHATIIIHDIFRTNRLNPDISDTSSYLDLAPLYGSSLKDQLEIRTMERGMLKPDTFHEKRLLAQPPGINVVLVMYSRFHNYVAEMLLKINEGGRFTLPPTRNEEEKKAAIAKQDNDLFQTARLIVNGLYCNISLHDYLRGLTNTHHSASSWTIDPRVEIKKLNGDEVPRGIGNQVSAEFNLLYRFHSTISLRDEKWLEEFLLSLFPGINKKLSELTPQELLQGLLRYEQNIDPDPSKREFAGLQRGSDGRFKDEDLVNVMTAAMEDPAGLFGARMVPKALKVVEILGILQSRKWRMASLNEFRDFFGLTRHQRMEDINSDPEIANLLRHLYDSPDMVELYPGLFLEDAKPRMDPGCGGCPPYTVGRAVFSDAITLVRSDRFYTIDYTPATLTNWGMQEVQQDYKVLGGSMFYKLFQRAVPGWYPYNSLHIMQPMFTWKMNKQIAEEIGTINQYTLAGPKPPPKPIVLTKHAIITKVLKDQTSFRVPWLPALNDLFPGKKDYSDFMLGGDAPKNSAQRALLKGILYGPSDFPQLLLNFVRNTAASLLKVNTFEMARDLNQINILKDIAIPVNTQVLGDLFCLDLKGPEHPNGTLSIPELYKHLLNVRVWGFNNNDPGMAFRRRLWAQEGAAVLTETTQKLVSDVVSPQILKLPWKTTAVSQVTTGSLRWYGQQVVKELFSYGKTVNEAADIVWLTALAGVGVPVGLFSEILQFFLLPENSDHWEKIQDVVASGGPTTDKIVREYVLEAQRLTSRQRNLRVCAAPVEIDGQKFKPGDAVICLLGPAGLDPAAVPEPDKFTPGRSSDAYIHFGYGPHECLGKEISITYCVGLLEVVASLKNVRPAPGQMGELKSIQVGTERCYLDDSWSWLTFDPTTWKLHYDGIGKGVAHLNGQSTAAGHDLTAVYNSLKNQDNEGPKSVTIAGSKQTEDPAFKTGLKAPGSGAPLGTPLIPTQAGAGTSSGQGTAPSSGTAPSGTAPSESTPSGTVASGTTPSGITPASTTAPSSGTAPSTTTGPASGTSSRPATGHLGTTSSTSAQPSGTTGQPPASGAAVQPSLGSTPPAAGTSQPTAPKPQSIDDWFFPPASRRDPDAKMPDHLQPPSNTTAPGEKGPLTPQSIDDWFFPPESRRDPNAKMPDHLQPPSGTSYEAPQANGSTPQSIDDWFFPPESRRDAKVKMPDHLQPPSSTSAPQSNGTDPQNIDDWFFPPESRRNPGLKMPSYLCPPGS